MRLHPQSTVQRQSIVFVGVADFNRKVGSYGSSALVDEPFLFSKKLRYNSDMSFQSFIMKRMLKSKMKDLPEDQQEKVLSALEKNPKLFENIALEVQEKMKGGKDQMAATMEVMQKYQADLKDVMN